MSKNEKKWDSLLNVSTSGRDDSGSDQHRYPYEPTPYVVLERLANSELIFENDLLVDYGCGKGRVGFFLSYLTRAKSIGIENNKKTYWAAIENKKAAVSAERVHFSIGNAEDYDVPPEVNRCYFFNPFSVVILQRVITRIIESYYLEPREILLFFYYPSEEYLSYLSKIDELEYMDEIDCSDLFTDDPLREHISIFRIQL